MAIVMCPRMTVTVETLTLTGPQLTALDAEWRSLEARASCSFFQSWSWIGCRVAEWFDSPLSVLAAGGEQTVGLALFHWRRRRLGRYVLWTHSCWLYQTGDAAEDSVFIEHNGPHIADDHRAAGRAILREALRRGDPVMLGGVGNAVLSDVRGEGMITIISRSDASYANLAAGDGRLLAHQAKRWIELVSRLSRQQLVADGIGDRSGVPQLFTVEQETMSACSI